jgi:predicted transcriptional regulator
MTIMTIRIPDDVKEALDKAVEGQDKDAIIAQIIRDGLAARGAAPEMLVARDEDLAERRRKAVDAIFELRKKFPALSNEEIRKAREEGRP